jgi:D-alanyl-D-alanine dipeptidase
MARGVVGRFCFACSYNVLLHVVVNYSMRCLVRHTAAAAFRDDERLVGAYKVRRPRHPV